MAPNEQNSAKRNTLEFSEYKSLYSWYSKKKPVFTDLVGEFGGQELFVLDGDSLLRKVLADEALGFDGKILPLCFCACLFVLFTTSPHL